VIWVMLVGCPDSGCQSTAHVVCCAAGTRSSAELGCDSSALQLQCREQEHMGSTLHPCDTHDPLTTAWCLLQFVDDTIAGLFSWCGPMEALLAGLRDKVYNAAATSNSDTTTATTSTEPGPGPSSSSSSSLGADTSKKGRLTGTVTIPRPFKLSQPAPKPLPQEPAPSPPPPRKPPPPRRTGPTREQQQLEARLAAERAARRAAAAA
jgi:hypothetical protein